MHTIVPADHAPGILRPRAAAPDAPSGVIADLEAVLRGVVDMHVHTAPDAFPRLLDDDAAATIARDKGLRAMVLKGHVAGTAERARATTGRVRGIQVIGALVCNPPAGGLSADAVDRELRLGARVVWGPTMWSRNHAAYVRANPSRGYRDLGMRFPDDGLTVLDERGGLLPEVREICSLIAAADAVLFTGHLSFEEAKVLVPEARRIGVRHVVVSHPEYENMNYSTEQQVWLADAGAYMEHTMSCHLPFWFPTQRSRYQTVWDVFDAIKAVGPERCILTSDLGQVHSPPPTEGFREFIQIFIALGAGPRELDLMTKENPARMLAL